MSKDYATERRTVGRYVPGFEGDFVGGGEGDLFSDEIIIAWVRAQRTPVGVITGDRNRDEKAHDGPEAENGEQESRDAN